MANPTAPSDALAAKVFHAVAGRYQGRADDLARFTATRYSFEEWLNWEAFAACCQFSEWQVQPKPSYCALGVGGCKDHGDLLVVADGQKVLVEIGLAHDGTGHKWRAKFDWDARKLARPLAEVVPLHVIVLVSESDIEASGIWQRWLTKVPCWHRPSTLAASASLPPSGAILIRGWVGTSTQAGVEDGH